MSARRFITLVFAVLSVMSLNIVSFAEEQKDRDAAEIEKDIKKAATTPPEWLEKTKLDYPKSLDLSWGKPQGKWDPNKNIGQYFWQIIRPNPDKWKGAIKFLHFLLDKHKNNAEKSKNAKNLLGEYYFNLGEWAHAAYWFRQDGQPRIELAYCYMKLGSMKMARTYISKFSTDTSGNGVVIRFLAELGQLENALKIARVKAASAPVIAHLAAGNACRYAGDFKKAAQFYEKAVNSKDTSRRGEFNMKRAKAANNAAGSMLKIDMKNLKDGKYRGVSRGYVDDLEVEIVVKDGKIDSVQIVRHKENQPLSTIKEIPARIKEKNGISGVDAVSGATITTDAILNATAIALEKAVKKDK